jgi:Cu(I)/Ag(I) efflux system membrane fusion protein
MRPILSFLCSNPFITATRVEAPNPGAPAPEVAFPRPLSRRAALITLACGTMGMVACSRKSGTVADPNVAYYTCTMHPFVRSQDPNGKCPICGMNLVPVMKKDAVALGESIAMGTPAGASEFSVPVERQQQIGVTYAAVEKRPLLRTIRAVGTVEPDKFRQWNLVARVEGYVQKLDVASPGEEVSEGQPLLTIYSPDVLTAEQDLVSLLEARRQGVDDAADRSLEAARRRLEQWSMTAEQIAELERTRKASELLTLCSPFGGVVLQAPPEQGRRVMVGDSLLAVADLSVVWVWAEFYEEDGPLLAKGQKVSLTTRGYPGEVFEGRVGSVDPFLNELTRTTRVRIDIPNVDLRLRPGMYANVELTVDMGEGLTIPVSAVMPTGEQPLVFVDKGEGRLEPRYINLGGTFDDRYEVKNGLREGERVVASGNFLIDAESQVEGAVKSFEGPEDAKSEDGQ